MCEIKVIGIYNSKDTAEILDAIKASFESKESYGSDYDIDVCNKICKIIGENELPISKDMTYALIEMLTIIKLGQDKSKFNISNVIKDIKGEFNQRRDNIIKVCNLLEQLNK